MEEGTGGLLKARGGIQPRVGLMRTSQSLGWDIQFAREQPLGEGGRRVVLATDRPLSFWELRAQPRSGDYAFTLAEIRLPKDGKGEASLATKAKIRWTQEARTLAAANSGNGAGGATELEA